MLTEHMLAVARAAAEAEMKSTCTITRPGGEPVWNEATGTYTDPPPDVVYTGRCKVQDSGRAAADAEAGERQATVTDQELHLPIESSAGVRRDDDVLIDTNPADPALVGRRFVIRAPHAGTAKTARRLPIQAVV